MARFSKLNRRSVLAGQAAIAVLGLSGTASAQSVFSALTADDKSLWARGTAQDFKLFLNQSFTAYAEDGSIHHLTLTEVQAHSSGPARPAGLKRPEGVSLTFKSDFAADVAPDGHRMFTLRHAELGDFNVMLSAHTRRSGAIDIDLVLN